MAGPWFEVEERAREIGAVAFSSNYELYANMSNRFMATLSQFSPRQEVYSIDECFLDLTGIKRDLVAYGHEIKETVTRWTGLPICVGIGYSKTLAKLANHYAKKQPELNGVCDFTRMSEDELDAVLEKLPVSSVWGIGRRLENSLKALGVENVLRLKRANLRRIRDRFGIVDAAHRSGTQWRAVAGAGRGSTHCQAGHEFALVRAKGGEPAGATGSHQLSCGQCRTAAAQAGPVCQRCFRIHPEQPVRSGRVLRQDRDRCPACSNGMQPANHECGTLVVEEDVSTGSVLPEGGRDAVGTGATKQVSRQTCSHTHPAATNPAG